MNTCQTCGRECPRTFCSRSCVGSSRLLHRNANWRGGRTAHPLYGIYFEIRNRRWADAVTQRRNRNDYRKDRAA